MKHLGIVLLGIIFTQNIKAQELKNNKMINDSNAIKKTLISSDSVHQLSQVLVS